MYLAKLADGQAVNVQVFQGSINLTVITDGAGVATVSRVDGTDAAAHTAGATNQFSVAAATRTVTPVDWPIYRISVAGGTCRVAVI